MNPGIISPERSSDSIKFRFWLLIPYMIISFSTLPLDVPYTLLYCTWLFLISLVISRQFGIKTKWKILIYLMLICRQGSCTSNHSNQRQWIKISAFHPSPYLQYTLFFPLTTIRTAQVPKLVWEGLSWSVQFSWFNCFMSFTVLCLKIFHLHCSSHITVNELQRIIKLLFNT